MKEMKDYYERRAAEYDATSYLPAGEDPVVARDLASLLDLVSTLEGDRMLDIGCAAQAG